MKKENTKLIAFLIFFLLQNTFSFAQESIEQYKSRLTRQEHGQFNSNKPINFTLSEDGKRTLVFSDKEKDQIIKTIDIREQNPFSDIGLKISGRYNDVFTFGKKRLGMVFPYFNFGPWIRANQFSDSIEINQVIVNYNYGDSNNGQYAAVSYSLWSDYVGICRTLFVVYDSIGAELNRLSVDVNVNQISITDDGRYLILSYGAYEEDEIALNKGIIILSIHENSLVVNKEIENLAGVSTFKNFIISGTHNYYSNAKEEVVEWSFYDLDKRIILIRELDVDCLGRAIITETGILMNCIDGTSYFLTFSNDFMVEDIR